MQECVVFSFTLTTSEHRKTLAISMIIRMTVRAIVISLTILNFPSDITV